MRFVAYAEMAILARSVLGALTYVFIFLTYGTGS